MLKNKSSAVLALFGTIVATIPAGRALAVGGQFGFEFAIDAPWRLEPVAAGDGSLSYGPIPVVIAFEDAVYEIDRGRLARLKFDSIPVGRLVEVRVREWTEDQPIPRHPVTIIPPSGLREIERRSKVSSKDREPDPDLCRPTPGRDCAELLDITASHDWQAAFWYTPRAPVTPGRNIHLEVTAVTEVPVVGAIVRRREWSNFLVVHAGEAPLPRFGDDWLYGDLHYHSQMTDNEGESGYAYRNVARALGAMGVDFVFATDHASNGSQVDGRVDGRFCAAPQVGSCVEARDLNVNRFAMAKTILYGPDGVNESIAREAEVGGLARLRAANILPQVYMGEEVDAWPEISSRELATGQLLYGNGLKYPWPDSTGCLKRSGLAACRNKFSRPYRPRDHRSALLLDEQGIPIEEEAGSALSGIIPQGVVEFFLPDGTRPEPSRQHVVYFPESASTGREGWIASDTGPFGGAGKRLEDVIGEIEAGGAAFLAHPAIGNRPGGPGPDVVPYSDRALIRAWSSSAILGLQFWNENDRHVSAPDRINPTVLSVFSPEDRPGTTEFNFRWPFQQHAFGNFPWSWRSGTGATGAGELRHGAFIWDRFLRRGLDPAATAALSWLPRGEPRKWFMAGGSDAHGDFNYRRYGRPCAARWCDVPVGDTAIANPRNLVSLSRQAGGVPQLSADPDAAPAGGPLRHPNRQLISALRSGNFSVTDGPALRIVVDRNRNGLVDPADLPMGSTLDYFPGEHIPVLVEWLSTPEFGPVREIGLYVGNSARTFGPSENGRAIDGPGYAVDPSGALKIAFFDSTGRFTSLMRGVVTLFIGPAQYGLATGDGALSYVRATARTATDSEGGCLAAPGLAGNKCGGRRAFSNPVWSRFRLDCPPRPASSNVVLVGNVLTAARARNATDSDGNGFPDTCERNLPDPCRPPPPAGNGNPLTGAVNTGVFTAEVGSNVKSIPATSCSRVSG